MLDLYEPFLEQLAAHPDPKQLWLSRPELLPQYADQIAQALKQQADRLIRTNRQQALATATFLFNLAAITANPSHEALGWRALGNVRLLGYGDYQTALAHYEQAILIYSQQNLPLEAAQSQVGKIGCLYLAGRYPEALQIGQTIQPVLQQQHQWGTLVGVLRNLALIPYRLGRSQEALELLEQASQLCQQHGLGQEIAAIELNRALALRVAGRLQQAIESGRIAEQLFRSQGQPSEAARAQLGQAITYTLWGQYTLAFDLFEQAKAFYLADDRQQDMLLIDRFTLALQLQLGRFPQVLEKCDQLQQAYTQTGFSHHLAQTFMVAAKAHLGLGQLPLALTALTKAEQLSAGNGLAVAEVALERAMLLYEQGAFAACQTIAESCLGQFQAHQLPIQTTQAQLLLARVATKMGDFVPAGQWIAAALPTAQNQNLPWLLHQVYQAQGNLNEQMGQLELAISAYVQAAEQLEVGRGHWAMELRSEFITNKQTVYEDLVRLHLAMGQAELALQWAERCKGRALLEMLAYKLDIRLKPRSLADQQIIGELETLQNRRNQLYRLQLFNQEQALQEELAATLPPLEKEITALWQTLLIRNADYARDQLLPGPAWQPIQPQLPADTLLIEFFSYQNTLLAFLVSREGIWVRELPGGMAALAKPMVLWRANLKAMAQARPGQTLALFTAAKNQLTHLYQLLLSPLNNLLNTYHRLIMVPHRAMLHYFPFQALYDGQRFLSESHEVSYLPSAALLAYIRPGSPAGCVTFGYSNNGQLPFAPQEAANVAQQMGGQPFLEQAATLAHFKHQTEQAKLIHLATHADFNQQTPLLSGLTLSDGQLTTLDIFQLRLQASLVTLSACHTGRATVGGGDELQGLMRAFLYAGATSLLLSFWQVNDQSTHQFMEIFYHQLAAGQSKTAALQTAQTHLMAQHPHPFHWAPFFLVGHNGPL